VHIFDGDTSIVIDTGPDFRQQMLRERVSHVDAVVFTHQHKDHTAGLDDVRSYNFKQGTHIPIYGRRDVLDQIKQEFSYIFFNKNYPGVPKVKEVEIDIDPFSINSTELIPIEVLHYKLPVLGFRIKDFTYITDAKTIAPSEKEKIRGSKILVLNALQKKEHISHLTLEEAIDLSHELKPSKTYLTHISHKLGRQKEIEQELPENVYLAHDGLTLEI
jgi:phosphoribosyl 1,2-cyclic phosphate phosphodiesterase